MGSKAGGCCQFEARRGIREVGGMARVSSECTISMLTFRGAPQ